MERKGGSSTVAVTAEEVRAAFARAKTLTSEEEKTLRMRHGVRTQDLRSPLPRAAGGNAELEDELLVLEMQLLRAHRRQQATATATAPGRTPAPAASRSQAKDKIVRALRKKK